MKLNRWVPKLFLGLFFSALLFSSFTIDKEKEEWTFLKEEANVKAFVKTDDCNGSSVFIFKFKNESKKPLSLNVIMEVVDEPTFGPITRSVLLTGNEFIQGDCDMEQKFILPNNLDSDKDLSERIKISIKLKTN